MKSMKAITKWLVGAAMAGALALAAPHQAQAQNSFGVRVGFEPAGYHYRSFGPARFYGWHERTYFGNGGWQPAYVPAWRYHRWERDRYYAHYRGY